MSDTSGQGSPLRIVIDESLAKSKPAELPADYADRGTFSERTTELRHRALALCRDRVSKELVKESEFDDVFKAIQKFWDDGPLTGTGPDKAFLKAQTAIEDAEERVAEHLRALEELQRQKEVFADRRDRLENRAATLVSGGFAKETDFAAAKLELKTLYDRDEVTGEGAERAFTALDDLIKPAEALVETSKLFTAELKSIEERIAVLDRSAYLPPDSLGDANTAVTEAKLAASTHDYPAAHGKLDTADKALVKAKKLADAQEELESNWDGLIDNLCNSSLAILDVDKDDLDLLLEPAQLTVLIKMEQRRALASKTQQPKQREAIRNKYLEFREINKANEPEEEDEDEPPVAQPPPETAGERRARIHTLKGQRKSYSALVALDTAGEIFRTVLFFANRGEDFKIGNTGTKGDFVPDYVAGYNVKLRRAPELPPGNGQFYDDMIIHIHFSDTAYSKIQRAHFKSRHAASDKTHVLIKSSDAPNALAICKRYL